MAKKNKNDLDIFEGDILDDNDKLIIDILGVKDTDDQPDDPILNTNDEYASELASKEAEKAMEEAEKAVISPPTPPGPTTILKGNVPGVVNINLKPGTALSNAIANPAENDNLLAVIRENKPINTVLKAVMEEIAEEAAYIKAWRNENWSIGEDISEATFKRIKMLKHLVETLVEQEKIKKNSATGKVDFHGEPFERVLKYFLETIQKTFRKVSIPEQFEDIFFTELAKAFDGFEKTAERLYYGKD